jgi:clan AA aspartic protease
MTGEVTSQREAVISLEVQAADDAFTRVYAVVDTGFTAALTLPPPLIASLSLPYVTNERVMLADGGIQRLRVYAAVVRWDGHDRAVAVHAANGGALIGMSLMYGHRLTIDVVDGGGVSVEPLPGSEPLH